MDPSAPLQNEIRRLRRRIRLLLCERWGLFGASAGAVVSAVLVLLSFKYDELLNYTLWAGLIILGALAGIACGLIKKLDDLTVAIAADKRTGLKERLSTAIAVKSGPADMKEALLADASGRVSSLKSKEIFQHTFGLPHRVFASALVVLMGVILVPQMPAFQSKTRQQEIAVMKHEGAKLVKLAKDMKRADSKHEQIRQLASKLEKLGGKMATGRMSRKQAMLKTQRLEKDIKKEQDRLARENSSSKTMNQAQSDMRKSSEQIAKSIADKIAKKENVPPEEALKKVASDKQLAQLARKDGPLSKSEQNQLEQAIAKYADPNNNAPIPAELGEALSKLAANKDYQKAAQLMQKLAQKLNSGKMSKADQKMLASQMQALAKALKNTDLNQLAKSMLNNANKLSQMSPKELQKMLDQAMKMQQLAKAMQKAGGG